MASSDDIVAVGESFQRQPFALDFCGQAPSYVAAIPDVSGVYFIAGTRNDALLKVYIGQAANIRQRIADYHRQFQVHSPNDYKLAAFQSWLEEHDPGWTLTLFILPVAKKDKFGVEAKWIRSLDPLVNGTARPEEDTRAAVKEAFCGYFTAYFRARTATDA